MSHGTLKLRWPAIERRLSDLAVHPKTPKLLGEDVMAAILLANSAIKDVGFEWQSNANKPVDGTICWLTDGSLVWTGEANHNSCGGWVRDTWEDFDFEVIAYIPLTMPKLPTPSQIAEWKNACL